MNLSAVLIGLVIVVFGGLILFSHGWPSKIFGLTIIIFGLLIIFNENEDKIEKMRSLTKLEGKKIDRIDYNKR